MKTLRISISPDSDVTIEANGFKGKGCKDATKAIEDSLGMVQGVKNKPEIHISGDTTNKQTHGH